MNNCRAWINKCNAFFYWPGARWYFGININMESCMYMYECVNIECRSEYTKHSKWAIYINFYLHYNEFPFHFFPLGASKYSLNELNHRLKLIRNILKHHKICIKWMKLATQVVVVNWCETFHIESVWICVFAKEFLSTGSKDEMKKLLFETILEYSNLCENILLRAIHLIIFTFFMILRLIHKFLLSFRRFFPREILRASS